MPTIYHTETWTQIAVITVLFGGGCAWQTGRAIALTWRPGWHVIPAMLLMGATVRFFHFALMGSALWAPGAYGVDTALLVLIAALAFRYTRAAQMARQYFWLYARRGPFSWRRRGPEADGATPAAL